MNTGAPLSQPPKPSFQPLGTVSVAVSVLIVAAVLAYWNPGNVLFKPIDIEYINPDKDLGVSGTETKTLVNQDMGIVFEYPKTWIADSSPTEVGVRPALSDKAGIYFTAIIDTKTFEQMRQSLNKKVGGTDKIESSITFGGVQAYGYTERYPQTDQSGKVISQAYQVLIQNNGRVYSLITQKYNLVEVKNIFESFKFSSQKTSTQSYVSPFFSFDYSSRVFLSETTDKVILNHNIPFKNFGCDMRDDAIAQEFLNDFNLEIRYYAKSMADTARIVSSYLPAESFVGETLKVTPGFIDEYKAGAYNGFAIYEGAEGCGKMTYYILADSNNTLVLQREMVQQLSTAVLPEIKASVLKVPGAISPEESEAIIKSLISSLKFN